MPHLHEQIDFTVALLIVHESQILLVLHRKLGRWLPIGGHIELDEDPEMAALREAREETGLEIDLIGERPPPPSPAPGRSSPHDSSTFTGFPPLTSTSE